MSDDTASEPVASLAEALQWRDAVQSLSDIIYETEEEIFAVGPQNASWKLLFKLAGLMAELSQLTGEVEHLETAIRLDRTALQKAMDASPREQAAILTHEGLCLGQQHLRSPGDVSSLSLGIEKMRLAVEKLSPETDLDLSDGLVLLLRKRSLLTPNDEDTRLAMSLAEDALNATPAEHVDWAKRYKAWGDALVLFLLREEQIGSLDTSPVITGALKAIYDNWHDVEKGPEEETPQRKAVAANLIAKVVAFGSLNLQLREDHVRPGASTSTQQKSGADPEDLQQLMEIVGSKLQGQVEGHEKTRYFEVLSAVTHPNDSSLEKAIDSYKAYVGQKASTSSLDSMVLGLLSKEQFGGTRDKKDLESALGYLKVAFNSTESPALTRLDAGRAYAALLRENDDCSKAYEVLSETVDLLQLVCTRFMSRENQEHNLSIVSGLAEEACAAALQAGVECIDCIKLLERASGLIMSFAIDRRTDIPIGGNDLDDTLREELISAREELNRVASLPPALELSEQAWLRYASLLDKAKSHSSRLDVFEPIDRETMLGLASGGAVVILNCDKQRCDAMVITNNSFHPVLLPKLRNDELSERMKTMLHGIIKGPLRTYHFRSQLMISLLNWLWETAIEPVWAVLRDIFKPLTDPRIWWMRTGPIALAPIHAAGSFSSEAEQSGFNKVISSYIPTLKALRYSRDKVSHLQNRKPKRFMAVSMPKTPGMKDLPSVKGEIGAITEILQRKQWECEELSRPCADEALRRMFDGYDVLHIACHGVSNFHQPAESALCFVKPAQVAMEEQPMEEKSEELDRLTVSRLSRAWLKDQALIVYLSACSTAGTMAERLANQVVHIASEFQLIGFPHVIGTLWKSQDEPCSRVATKFYEELLVQDCFDGDGVTVAKALNEAVAELRKEDPSNVFAWLPFVHYGP